MRALAHPFRLTLLELVGQHGTLTATRAAELTGESSASCSFHLRQLAKYGFLEQAEGAGGRERPWRLTATSHEWTDEPEAADLLDGLLLARAGEQLSDWLTRRRQEPREWREAASGTFSLLYARSEELTELWHGLVGLLQPFDERVADPGKRPEGARPVRFFASGFPLPDDRSQRDT
jgi:predicted ArsR family transcriptional regulator